MKSRHESIVRVWLCMSVVSTLAWVQCIAMAGTELRGVPSSRLSTLAINVHSQMPNGGIHCLAVLLLTLRMARMPEAYAQFL